MNPERETPMDRAADPWLIPGIYNYCNRWCERCQFTERCLMFRDLRQDEAHRSARGPVEQVHDSFRKTFALVEAWCEREGIDFKAMRREANSEESRVKIRRADEAIERDPLHQLARTYTHAACELIESLEKFAPFHAWNAEVRDAIDTIGWHAGMVSTKICRALQGSAECLDDGVDWDPVQNDWNGSAKVAHLAITESRKAWDVLLNAGQAAPDSPIHKVIEILDRAGSDLVERFPRAPEFGRPGFDEPEIAAGTPSTTSRRGQATSLRARDPINKQE